MRKGIEIGKTPSVDERNFFHFGIPSQIQPTIFLGLTKKILNRPKKKWGRENALQMKTENPTRSREQEAKLMNSLVTTSRSLPKSSEAIVGLITQLKPEEWNSVDKLASIKYRMENPVCLLMNQIAQVERLGIKTLDISNQTNMWRQQLQELRLREALAAAGDNARRRLQIEIAFWEKENPLHLDLPSLREKLKQLDIAEMRRVWLAGTEPHGRTRLSQEVQFLRQHVPDSVDLPILSARLAEMDRLQDQKVAKELAEIQVEEWKQKIQLQALKTEYEKMSPLESVAPPVPSSSSPSGPSFLASPSSSQQQPRRQHKRGTNYYKNLNWQTLPQLCGQWFVGIRRNNRFAREWEKCIEKEVHQTNPSILLAHYYSGGRRLRMTPDVIAAAPLTLRALRRYCKSGEAIPRPPPSLTEKFIDKAFSKEEEESKSHDSHSKMNDLKVAAQHAQSSEVVDVTVDDDERTETDDEN